MMAKTKFLETGAILVLLVLLVSACTIEKRRHFSGYHIDLGIRPTWKNADHGKRVEEVDVPPLTLDRTDRCTDLVDQVVVVPHQEVMEMAQVDRPANDQEVRLTDFYADVRSTPHVVSRSDVWKAPVLHVPPAASKTKAVEGRKKRSWARLIGLSLLLMALVAGTVVPAFSKMYVAGDVARTSLNVTSDLSRFRMSVAGWIVILALDLLAAFGIYKYSKDEEPKLAKLTGASRLLYSIVLGAGVVQLLGVSASSTEVAIYHGLDKFNSLWGIGLILFGVHLIALAFLFKKEAGKNWLSTVIFLLLLFAGIGYIIQYTGILLVADPVAFAALVEPIFIVPMVLGEVSYAIWKLVRGGKGSAKDPEAQDSPAAPSHRAE